MIGWARARVRSLRARLSSMRYKGWSTRDVFEHIYAERQWGSPEKPGPFDSGAGSASTPSIPYVTIVRDYIQAESVKVVADLGCGDFRVGKQICQGLDIQYIGVDVVRPLIGHLNPEYQSNRTKFLWLDLIEDELPEADIYLIRQVFQHLGNQQIQVILKKLRGKTVFVTEHLPTKPAAHNKSKLPGPDIRLYRKSGVFLEYPPFSLKTQTLLEGPQPFNGIEALLRTSLLRNV
jgi:hypothetical protein